LAVYSNQSNLLTIPSYKLTLDGHNFHVEAHTVRNSQPANICAHNIV